MNKQAPSLGKLVAMVGFALSCFGLLLFLWLAFGGPIPLQAQGLPHGGLLQRGPAARRGGRRADLRRAGGQGQVDRGQHGHRHDGGHAGDRGEVRADPARLARDAAPEDAPGRDLRRAHAGQRERGPARGGRPAARGAVAPTVELDEMFRDLRRPSSGATSRSGCSSSRSRRAAAGATSTRRSATWRRSPSRRRDARQAAQRPGAGAVRASCATPARSSRRSASATASCAGLDRELRPHVRRSPGRRAQELRETFIALPTFERESRGDRHAAHALRRQHPPARQPAAPLRRASCRPTLKSLNALAPDLRDLFQRPRPGDHRLRARPARRRRRAERAASDAARADAAAQAAQPQPRAASPTTARRSAPSWPTRSSATNAYSVEEDGERLHYLRVVNPVNPENLAVYPRRIGQQPHAARTCSRCRRLRRSCRRAWTPTRPATAAARGRSSPRTRRTRRRSPPPTARSSRSTSSGALEQNVFRPTPRRRRSRRRAASRRCSRASSATPTRRSTRSCARTAGSSARGLLAAPDGRAVVRAHWANLDATGKRPRRRPRGGGGARGAERLRRGRSPRG